MTDVDDGCWFSIKEGAPAKFEFFQFGEMLETGETEDVGGALDLFEAFRARRRGLLN